MARTRNNVGEPNRRTISPHQAAKENPAEPALDLEKIEARMDALGINQTKLAELAELGRNSIVRMIRTGVAGAHVRERVGLVLKMREAEFTRQPTRQELAEQSHKLPPPNGWTIASIESPPLMAANGVSYQVAKLEKVGISHRFSRGKFYDLIHVAPRDRAGLNAILNRHAAVCSMFPKNSLVPVHYDTRPLAEDTAWWVLDEWIDSKPLATLLDSKMDFERSTIKAIGTNLLEGLSLLHRNGVIVRELAPERILIAEGSNQPVITDFELARLLNSEISVSGKWKYETVYRAPEVGDNDPHIQSDLYSWAVIVTEMLTGSAKSDSKAILPTTNSRDITALIMKCRDNLYHHRPLNAETVLDSWIKWKV